MIECTCKKKQLLIIGGEVRGLLPLLHEHEAAVQTTPTWQLFAPRLGRTALER